MANVLHSIELSIKAALSTVVKGEMRTHQVAGLFGEHFRTRVGKELCRDIARALMRYNLPRYPGEEEVLPKDVKDALRLARRLRDETVPALLKGKK